MKPTIANAVSLIDRHGALLAFPLKDKAAPLSLWHCFFPRSKMIWDWSESGDGRVAQIWHLRTKLSSSRKVVYTKWFQGRATFFSLELFAAMLHFSRESQDVSASLPEESRILLEILEDDSPLPTKELRRAADLQGRDNETRFNRGLRTLWANMLIVGFGEVEEGGFPSLAIGASRLLFEDQWEESLALSDEERESRIHAAFPVNSPFHKQYLRLKNKTVLPFADANSQT